MTIKKILTKYGMSQRALSERFDIPLRTIQNWAGGQRECAEYIIKMMDEILKREREEKLMKLYVADAETGTFMDEVKSIEEGIEMIKKYEEDDKANGSYEEDYYDVVNGDHETVYSSKNGMM